MKTRLRLCFITFTRYKAGETKACTLVIPLISKKDLSELLDILKRNNFKVKAIFLEVYPYNYESIKTINLLRKIFGLQKMGFAGNTYEKLESLLSFEDIYTPNVFFERN